MDLTEQYQVMGTGDSIQVWCMACSSPPKTSPISDVPPPSLPGLLIQEMESEMSPAEILSECTKHEAKHHQERP